MKTFLLVLILILVNDFKYAISQTDTVELRENNDLKSQEYEYLNHDDFKIFYKDFKNAVNTDDKEAVLRMVNIPFIDYLSDVYYKDKSFTSLDTVSFLNKYDKIFNSDFKQKLNANDYEGWTKEAFDKAFEEDQDLLISEGQYISCVNYANLLCFVYDKHNGMYKLSYITYYP